MIRVHRLFISALLLLVVVAAPFGVAVAEGAAGSRSIAVFDFELVDTSGERSAIDHDARLQFATREMRALLEATGKFRSVDIGPASEAVARAGHLHTCNGCEAEIARSLGADLALVGTVYKVSSLILYMRILIVDADTGQLVSAPSVSIRGDNEKAWLRGLRYIVKNRIDVAG